ncbi:hypothetical protein TRAPUB_13322 [Trametes pubescens]|uniref:Peptidase S26 domain-containing protein n=1 Tax=Trametes pubescens TaxID=154538 RepID=A0A1M2VRJ0_TRAPU|nr:hypothetical protein TRAPUB_13322 [Trametes pubescens]
MQALRGVRARVASIRQVSRTVFARGSSFRWTLSALVWLPLAIFVTEYGMNVKVIPALNPDDSASKDIAVFDSFSIRFAQSYNRGDIVALQSPSDSKRIVKRIVALEGDIVSARTIRYCV